jgi:hypothetical protein
MQFHKTRQRGGPIFLPVQLSLELQFDRQQAGPARILRVELIDVLKAGQPLIAAEHALDLVQLANQVGTTELQLLACAGRTQRIRIKRHRRRCPWGKSF